MRIVIIEDSELIRAQLERLLVALPRIELVGTASEEEEAVSLILRANPDVALLDIGLSPGSGLKVLERIRQAGSGTRVVILSNYVDAALAAACRAGGATEVFDKSLELDACLARLQAWLPPLPVDEGRRLERLRETQLLDSGQQEMFDALTRLACEVAQVPVALISLVSEDRQWFLARTGTELRETSRSIAFCAHTILGSELMEVTDAREDERFRDNPLVVGAMGIRFYAGVPLVLPSGEALGSLCVIGDAPKRLSDGQSRALKALAGRAVAEIEMRRRVGALERDAVRHRTTERRLHKLATRDPLTGLPNRAAFRDSLDQHLRLCDRRRTGLGVLFIDLDGFKPVNDTFGHDAGDAVLVAVGERLRACLRGSDVVARIGGDEFAAVLPDVPGSADALGVAEKIVAALGEPIVVAGRAVQVGASVGVAVFPEHARRADTLLRHADEAMYRVKQDGGARACLWSRAIGERAEASRSLERDLRAALQRGELDLEYLPQVDLATGRPLGVETKLRWRHDRLAGISRRRIGLLVEQAGCAHALDLAVLDRALAQVEAWDAAGVATGNVCIPVSTGALDTDYVELVADALRRRRVAPHRIELVISEASLAADAGDASTLPDRLRALGVRIALDGLGVGQSSIQHLRRWPVDTLRIDRHLVESIETSSCDRAIVEGLARIAVSIGARSIAVGVDRTSQIEALRKAGCLGVQGPAVAAALAPDAAARWLRATGLHGVRS